NYVTGGPYLPTAGGTLSGNLGFTGTNGIVGTATNNNAAAGNVGEYVAATVASGAAIALTTGNWSPVTSITLQPGDWDVFAEAWITTSAGASVMTANAQNASGMGLVQPSANASSAYIPAPAGQLLSFVELALVPFRIPTAVPLTIYLN